jgi:cobalt-zinc-cadmium efflux system outer membrane protein
MRRHLNISPSSLPFTRTLLIAASQLTHRLKHLIIWVPGVLFCMASGAQTSAPETSPKVQLNIEDLVRSVLKYNASLQSGLRTVDIARAAVITSSALPNPRFELDTGRNGATHSASQAGSVVAVGVSQFIENPALRSARVDTALYAENTSVESLGQIRNDLVAQVKLRSYEYLLRREEALAASDALSLLEQIRERVRLRVETGEAGRYELIKSDAEIINARQKQQTAQLQIAQAAISLNRLAGGQLPPHWELDAQLSDATEVPQLPVLKETALRENPELRVLESELDRNKSRINETYASRWPGVDIKLAQINQPDVRQNLVGVSVQIPLLDQKRGPRAEAIAERERTLARLEGRRAELVQQLELSWKSVEIAQIRIKALSEGAMRDAEAALRVAQAAYRFGERGILEVLDAERVLRAVRQDLLLARYQLQASLIDLDLLAGRYAQSRD